MVAVAGASTDADDGAMLHDLVGQVVVAAPEQDADDAPSTPDLSRRRKGQ